MIGYLPPQAVTNYLDFDLENNEELQEIIEVASTATSCPFAFVSFLDEDTQYVKVKKGIDHKTVPRKLSLCTHAIKANDLLVVHDTLKDIRFVNHPMVVGNPGVRFFASIPLAAQNGAILGSLCVFDTAPHDLADHQHLVLRILAKQVLKIIELKIGAELLTYKQGELDEQKKINNDADIRLRSFFESSINFQVLLGKCGEVIDFNKSAFNFIKAVHKSTLKRDDQFIKYLHPEFIATFIDQYALALQGKRSAKEGSTNYEEMGVVWWEAGFEPAKNNNDEIIGVSYLIRNVTERKLKEQKIISQNKSLLKIAHIQAHEFRAPLTTIMGLMGLIKEEDYNAPSEYIQLLEQAVEALDTTIRLIVTDIDNTVMQDYVGELQNVEA